MNIYIYMNIYILSQKNLSTYKITHSPFALQQQQQQQQQRESDDPTDVLLSEIIVEERQDGTLDTR